MRWRLRIETTSGDVYPADWTDVNERDLRRGQTRFARAETAAQNYGRGGVWDGNTYYPPTQIRAVHIETQKDEPAKAPAKKPAAKKPAKAPAKRRTRTSK